MSHARAARRIATAAAYGGGGVGLAGLATYTVLQGEARLARHLVGDWDESFPDANGLYGPATGDPLSLVILGDSIAAGVGLTDPEETTGALLANGLAALSAQPVRLTSVAVSGARSSALGAQAGEALRCEPDLAVIIVGGNDVLHRIKPTQAVRDLDAVVRRLRDAGCAVLVATCPDMGTVRPIIQPLRRVVRRASRRLAAAQTIAVVEAGGRSVSLGDLLGPAFEAEPTEMFGPDKFHPSARGHASAAAALLPSACAVLGRWPESTEESLTGREDVLPVYLAAARAADTSGTEVAGTEVSGKESGPRGRWARLLRPRARRGAEAADASHTGSASEIR